MSNASIASAPEPAKQSQKYKVAVAQTAVESQKGTATVLAITGFILWCIQTYAFNGNMPSPVAAAMYVIVPSAVGWASTHIVVEKVTI